MSPRIQLVVAAALFSTGGAAIKATSFTGLQVASLRSGIAAVTLLLLLPAARRGWGWRPLLVGVAYAATMVLFVLANRLTTSAHAVFIQATSPVYLVLLAPLLLGERNRRRDLWYMLPILAGLSCFLVGAQAPQLTAPDPRTGNLLALGAGFCWACTTIGMRWLAIRPSGHQSLLSAMVTGNLIAFLAVLPAAVPLAGGVVPWDWGVVVFLGVFQIALPYSLVARAMGQVETLDASLIFLIEPALNPVVAWAVHGEIPGSWPMIGAVVILVASTLRVLGDRPRIATLDPPAAAA